MLVKLDTSQTITLLYSQEQGFVLLIGAQPSPWKVLSLISGFDVKSLVVYHAQKVSGKPGRKLNGTQLFGCPSGKFLGASKHLKRQSCFSGTECSKGKFLFHFDVIWFDSLIPVSGLSSCFSLNGTDLYKW